MMTPLKFLAKSLMPAAVPLAVLAVLYVVCDPMKALRERDDYFADGISVNKGIVTINNYEEQSRLRRYDSFIFGSSLSCYYTADDWGRYLPAVSTVYHLDTSGQTTLTMRRMAEYLDRRGDTIKNALVVLDPFIFLVERDRTGMIYIDPPAIRREWWYRPYFHYRMFASFLDARYLADYLPRLLTGRKDADGRIFEPQPVVWDKTANEETLPSWDAQIATDAEAFYRRYPLLDLPSAVEVMPESISPEIRADLQAIADIFRRHATDFRVVMGPNRRRLVLSEADDRSMREIFGDAYFNLGNEFAAETADRTNFYDDSHYRRTLASKILKRVYDEGSVDVVDGN